MADRPRRRGFGSVGLLVSVLVSGCASIPTSGAVQTGTTVQTNQDQSFVRVLARLPTPGLSRVEVVRGFLAANASFEDDHAVARAYLTAEASTQWDADAGATIYDERRGVTVYSRASSIEVTGRKLGAVGAQGEYSIAPRGARIVGHFVLHRVGGEWRIAGLADGLILTRLDVDRAYRPFNIYFLAPGTKTLVPDPVLLPVSRPSIATSLVDGLLSGPTPWLAPAVRTAFPHGAALAVDAVPVANGVAQVDLDATALRADSGQIEAMAAQLAWTLAQLPDVTGVRLSVDGSALPVPTGTDIQTVQTAASYSPDALPLGADAYAVRHGALTELVQDQLRRVPGAAGTGQIGLTLPAASPSGSALAALSTDRRTLFVQRADRPGRLVPVFRGTGLIAPSFDEQGELWVVGRTPHGSQVWTVDPTGRVRPVEAPGLRSSRVISLRVARDGTRVACVLEGRGGRGHLLIGRVVRRAGVASIGGLRPIERSLNDIREVSWAAADRLLVLGRRTESVQQPYTVDLEGLVESAAGTLPGMVTVTAAPGHSLLAGTANGRVWRDTGFGWQQLARGLDPVYQG